MTSLAKGRSAFAGALPEVFRSTDAARARFR
jgi:hypothetical protein